MNSHETLVISRYNYLLIFINKFLICSKFVIF